MSKKFIIICFLITISVREIKADDLADILQDLAIQTACQGMYSSAEAGIRDYITDRFVDPYDWYTPSIMALRFAQMSGNMTRTNTFYGICFDYAQFAWDDIKRYQTSYNEAGMKDQQWYIAVTNPGDPNTIILYDPVTADKATKYLNGIPVREKSRYRVRAHDDATGHAWLWIQHKNGTWYWIDPTWTDNTGWPWWGMVHENREVKYNPFPSYCIASNYPRPPAPKETPVERETRSPSSTYTNYNPPNYGSYGSYFLIGYNYANNKPLGITIGFSYLYASINIGDGAEWVVGLSFPILGSIDSLIIPFGMGWRHSSSEMNDMNDEKGKFVMEIGIQPVLGFIYLSATYRLIGFKESGFSLGAGLLMN